MAGKRQSVVTVGLAILACVVICLIWRPCFLSKKDGPYNCKGANIILISIDALRADQMGCYGYKRKTTRSIDKFSKKSIFFQQAYAPWPKNTPSFASFFTGMLPFTTGVVRLAPHQWLDDKLVFLTEILKKEGYFTQGRVTNPNLAEGANFNQGFDVYDCPNDLDARSLTKLAIADLRKITKEKPQERFLYWVHYMDPHRPYKPPKKYVNPFINDELYNPDLIIPVCEEKPNYVKLDKKMDPYEKTRRKRILKANFGCLEHGERSLSKRIARYDGEINFADENIGILLDEIKTLGLFDNSIIVLWADHGESLGDHNFYFDHGRLPYNPCLKVPLIIYHPNIEPRIVKSTVSLTDVFPTLLGMLEVNAVCEGEDIKDLILGEEKERTVFASAGYAVDYQKIMTDGRWKLIYVPDKLDQHFMKGSEHELYDLQSDPQEKNNMYGKNVQGMYLREVMDHFLENSFREHTSARKNVVYSLEILRQLKSLGYIE